VGQGELRRGERRFVNAGFYVVAGGSRFVEKTPANSLRIPYLFELFPDASVVVMHRNPCDVINSLITGWRLRGGRFRSLRVPASLDIPAYPYSRVWSFVLVDGWLSSRSGDGRLRDRAPAAWLAGSALV
jgi:sulfotransferase family protein